MSTHHNGLPAYLFYPDGTPRFLRCFDTGDKNADRYDIQYTGRYKDCTARTVQGFAASADPCHPQGFGQHYEGRPGYAHVRLPGSKPIDFRDLPEKLRNYVLGDYRALWLSVLKARAERRAKNASIRKNRKTKGI